MYKITDIDTEIHNKVEWLEANNGAILHKDWLTQAVLSDHKDVFGEDADMATCCMRETVSIHVRTYFNKHKVGAEVDPQLTLEGFDRLQKRYSLDRDGERVLVRVHDMLPEEIIAKAEEYEAMGKACIEHADELRRFCKAKAS